jgi:RNA polymerase sigma factor (sigma-70 family)
MAMGNDAELLQDYLAGGSEPAFARLVRQYIDLVYSAARRQVRDEHLAQDITQAVFILLSQKAAAIRNPAALPAWLLKTTHYVACNALREQRRRANREKEAAAMTPLVVDPEQDAMSQQITAVLDMSLARLREADRCAIVLRFLEGKSLIEVGNSMGISQAAAQQRVTRALARLRRLFARHGLHTPADALSENLSSQLLLTAPPGLIALVSAKGTAKGAAAISLAKATLRIAFWSYVRAAAIGCTATVVLAGGVAIVALGASPASPPPPPIAPTPASITLVASLQPTSAPALDTIQKFPNALFFNTTAGDHYLVGIDQNTRRTERSDPAGYIKSIAPKASLNQGGGGNDAQRTFAAAMDPIRGKRIRLTAWIKTRNVDNWCGLEMWAYGWFQRVQVHSDMAEHPISGTTDWKQYSLVVDVPDDAQSLMFQATMLGTGEMWSDDFQIQIVGNDVPTTDDQLWHMWSPAAPRCSAVLDPRTLRDGHPTMRVTCNANAWVSYDHYDRHPEPYLGKRVRVSAWLKADHVSVVSGLWIRMIGANFQKISEEGNWGQWATAKPIKGTGGWTHFVCEADVPPDTQCIRSGLIHNGTGTMWMDDFKFELADTPPAEPK